MEMDTMEQMVLENIKNRIKALLNDEEISVLSISKALLKFQTITPEDNGCLDWIASFLQTIGFSIVWLDSGNIKNLYAKYATDTISKKNISKKNICFVGHTDVVPTGENWSFSPFVPHIVDEKLYARGTADMKCAIACWLMAVFNWITNNEEKNCNVSILLTGDEEAEAIHGLRTTLDFLKTQNINLFLLGEPTALEYAGDCVKIGRRGSVTAKLTVFGKQGHIAYPNFASNPIDLLDKVFYGIEEKLSNTQVYPFGACKIVRTSIDVGNTAENVIPGKASMCFGIRFNNLFDVDSMQSLIESVCQECLEKYELTISKHGNPFLTKNEHILEWVKNNVSDITKQAVMFDAKGATSDGRFLAAIADVIECGFLENQAHQTDEYVSLLDLKKMEEIYYRLLSTFHLAK